MSADPSVLIADISEEQERTLAEATWRWFHIASPQGPDKEAVAAALGRLADAHKLKMPPILWCESPWQVAAMKTMLSLYAVTRGTDEDLWDWICGELKLPMWRHMIEMLRPQLPPISLPLKDQEGNPVQLLLGMSIESEMRAGVSAKCVQSRDLLSTQLSLPAKLKLRAIFRNRNRDEREAIWNERIPLVQTDFGLIRFGLIRLLTFISSDMPSEFISQLSRETLQKLESVCETRLPRPVPWMETMGRQARLSPLQRSFESLEDHLAPPGALPDFRAVALTIRELPVSLPDDLRESIADWLTMKENIFHLDVYEKVCIACAPPIELNVNERSQLHNERGPAMVFSDDTQVFALNGVVLPARAIVSPDQITVGEIEDEGNLEIRRIFIQQYGLERYLKDSGAVQIDAGECGVLYKKSLPNDEPVVAVKVINATPEPDGTYKFYFLRVPPHITTARAAVAWTFNMSAEDYQPTGES